jgi:PAS domain-containing protein
LIEKIFSIDKTILIYAKDKNSKYLFCNEAVAELSGLDSPKQVIGKTDADLFWRKYSDFYVSIDHTVMHGNMFTNQQVPFTQRKYSLNLPLLQKAQ